MVAPAWSGGGVEVLTLGYSKSLLSGQNLSFGPLGCWTGGLLFMPLALSRALRFRKLACAELRYSPARTFSPPGPLRHVMRALVGQQINCL